VDPIAFTSGSVSFAKYFIVIAYDGAASAGNVIPVAFHSYPLGARYAIVVTNNGGASCRTNIIVISIQGSTIGHTNLNANECHEGTE
jgi:hypothetical protein